MRFQPISPRISETVRDRAGVTGQCCYSLSLILLSLEVA